MDTKMLLTGIKDIIALEVIRNNYLEQNIMIESSSHNLGEPKDFFRKSSNGSLEIYKSILDVDEKQYEFVAHDMKKATVSFVIGLPISIVKSVIITIIEVIILGMLLMAVGVNEKHVNMTYYGYGLIIITSLILIFNLVNAFKKLNSPIKENNLYKKYNEMHKEEIDKANAKIRNDKNILNIEREQKNRMYAVLDANLESVNIINQKISDLYTACDIYFDYRNLSAMYKIYQYLESGRCNELQGNNGAYNLYENERRLDKIIEELKNINYRLYMIDGNIQIMIQQFDITNSLLYEIKDLREKAVETMNEKVNQFVGAIKESNSSIYNDVFKSIDQRLAGMEHRDFQRYTKYNDANPYMSL